MLVFGAIMPHPPVSVPGIGNQEEIEKLKKTLNAFEILREGLENARPDIVVVISPHAKLEPYSFVVNSETPLRGSLQQFGIDQVFDFKNDLDIAEQIVYACNSNEIPAHLHPGLLDHGALIPLYHLMKNIHPHVVHLSFSMMNFQMHCRYGDLLGKIFDSTPKRIAVIASGDLSHKLNPNAPAGFSERAKFFDQQILESLGCKNYSVIIGMQESFIEEMAECGLRSIVILMCILQGKDYTFNLLSYEGPFGIGYLTARLL
jgi:aromatic ring-opening dioxygenase LigB subunit